ncbi:MAG: hypothetical protein GYA36_01655 [Veillonellaceae bacterium]|nr:hypothetical protein [Veillonellaceae bacterium]
MATYVRYFDTLEDLMEFVEIQERVNGIKVLCDKERRSAAVFGIDEELAHDLLLDEYEEVAPI